MGKKWICEFTINTTIVFDTPFNKDTKQRKVKEWLEKILETNEYENWIEEEREREIHIEFLDPKR